MNDEIYLRYLTWMVTHDQEFLSLFAEQLRSADIEDTEYAWLVETSVEYYIQHGGTLDLDALLIALSAKQDVKGFDKDVVAQYYEEALAPADEAFKGFVTARTRDWLAKLKFMQAAEKSMMLIEEGNLLELRDLWDTTNAEAFVGIG